MILILEGILKKKSYEGRDYESVDGKILSLSYVMKNNEKKTSCSNGLKRLWPASRIRVDYIYSLFETFVYEEIEREVIQQLLSHEVNSLIQIMYYFLTISLTSEKSAYI